MTNVRYTDTQRLKALEVFDRTQSATKTVRELGYPGRWTLHRWIRERDEPPAAPIRRTTLKRYPLATKLKAVELFTAGMSPDAIASELSLNSKMSVYAWAQRFREEGKWGLMSATERKRSAGIVTRKTFEKSLPDDAAEGPDPRKVDTSGVSYAAWVSVADVSASKSSGARRLHQECRLRVL